MDTVSIYTIVFRKES